MFGYCKFNFLLKFLHVLLLLIVRTLYGVVGEEGRWEEVCMMLAPGPNL